MAQEEQSRADGPIMFPSSSTLYTNNNNHNHNNELMVYQTSFKRGDEPRQSVAQFVVIALVDLLVRLYRVVVNTKFLILQSD